MEEKTNELDAREHKRPSLDDILNQIGFGPFQVIAFLLAGLTSLAFGFEITVFSLIADSLRTEWGVNGVKLAILPSVTGVSNILGGLVYGYLCDNYGRVWPYVVAMLNIAVFSLASAFSPNFVTFVCLRFAVSFGVTGSVVFLFAALVEVLPVHNRGKVLVLVMLVEAVGICATGGLAWWLMPAYPKQGWRYLVIASALPSFIAVGYRLFFYFESPRFLIIKKRYKKAHRVLSAMVKFNGKDLNMFPTALQDIQLPEGTTHSRSIWQSVSKLLFIFKKTYLRTTLCLSIIYVLHTSAFYGSSLFLPSVLHDLVQNSYFVAFIGYVGQIPGVLLMSIIVEWEHVGRLNSLRFFTLLSIGSFSVFAFVQNAISIPVLTILLYFSMVPLTALTLSYMSEVYPTDVRGFALAYFQNLSAFFGIFIPYVGGYTTDVFNHFPWLFSIIWAGFYLVIFVVSLFLKQETLRHNLLDHS